MERRKTTILAVSVLLASVVAIQLADPRFGKQTAPEVDFSEPPAEVAADAATQFEYVDYSYRIELKNKQNNSWDALLFTRVDHSNRRYRSTGPLAENGTIIFGNDALTFAKPGRSADWRFGPNPETTYPAHEFTQPFSITDIQNSNITIADNNSTTLLLSTDSVILNYGDRYPGNTTIVINRSSGLIEKATSTYYPDAMEVRFVRFIFVTKNPHVRRPNDIPPSTQEIVWDLIRGPVVEWPSVSFDG